MDQREIEQIVGKLYLLIMDRERQIAELQAERRPQGSSPPLTMVPKDAG